MAAHIDDSTVEEDHVVNEHTALLGNHTPANRFEGTSDGTGSTTTTSSWKKPSPLYICFPLFVGMFSYSVSAVPAQQFMLVYLCGKYQNGGEMDRGIINSGSLSSYLPSANSLRDLPDFEKCHNIPQVQAMAANWQMILSLATSLPAVLAIPLIGALSDSAGRKPVMYLPILSGLIGGLALVAVAQFDIGLWILIAAHILQGAMGGYTTILMTAFAYIADVTKAEERSQKFIYIEALIFVAFTLGPYCGGALSRILPHGVIDIFYVTIAGCIITILYIFFILPESVDKRAKTVAHSDTDGTAHPGPAASTKESLISIFQSLGSVLRLLAQPPRAALISMIFIVSACLGGAVLFFYFAMFRLGWDAYAEGVFLLYSSFARIFWMLGVGTLLHKVFAVREVKREVPTSTNDTQSEIPPSVTGVEVEEDDASTAHKSAVDARRVGIDLYIVRAGFLSTAIGWFFLAFVQHSWEVYVVFFFTGLGTLGKPILRSLLSRSFPATLQGRLFSTTQLVDQVAVIISSLIFPPLWAATVNTSFPGAFVFLVGIFFSLATFVGCVFVRSSRVLESFHVAQQSSSDISSAAFMANNNADGSAAEPLNGATVAAGALDEVPHVFDNAKLVDEEGGLRRR